MSSSGIIYSGCITVRAIANSTGTSFPALDWVMGLEPGNQARVQAALKSVDNSFVWKRPYAGRLEKIEGSAYDLFELRITRGGARGPQLRFIGFWRGTTFWVAHAFWKRSPRIRDRDIKAAERAFERWRSGERGDRPEKAPKKGSRGRGRKG